MTDSDNDRIAYLAGDTVESLPRAERAELDELRALLRSAETWEEPDPGLEDRIVAAIAQETVTWRRAPAAADEQAPATAAEAAPAPAPQPRRSWRERLRIRPRAYGFIGAAAAVAAAIVAVIVIASSGTTQRPLQFAMVVSGTPLAPGAHGSATLTKTASGWRIVLKATGLPHLANGRFYQAWLKNPAGVLVPVGTFNDARDVTLWSGVPVTQYRAFSVTIQQANGNPASSGLRVLTGTAHPAG
ncbi:MAG TPA: anti-sigma factor [Solirubrobacteraceae bacterium]|nr:anti-sigma factor [Solirubrobacteraceae bacterium]